MRVLLIRAERRQCARQWLDLPAGARVRDALDLCTLPLAGVQGQAVFGEVVQGDHLLQDGDRLELLLPLRIDPKQARRERAAARAVKAARDKPAR